MSDSPRGFARVREAVSLREFCEYSLEQSGRTFVCPSCGSGTGPNGTPAFSLNPNGERNEFGPTHWRCFSCGSGGDVFDLYGLASGCEGDRVAQLRGVAEWAGIPLEGEDGAAPPARHARRSREPARPRAKPGEAARVFERRVEVAEKLQGAREAIADPRALAFLASHGLDEDAARRHGLGFTDSYRLGRSRYPALLIPYPGSPWYYAARILDPAAPHKYDKPRAGGLGREPLWNPAALDSPAFFVVEGQLDALAVAEAGYEAVALGTSGSTRLLLDEVRRRRFAGIALVMTDNDPAGMDGCVRTCREIFALRGEGLGVFPHVFPWPDGAPKDAAEWLAQDPEGMREAMAGAVAVAEDGRRRVNSQ